MESSFSNMTNLAVVPVLALRNLSNLEGSISMAENTLWLHQPVAMVAAEEPIHKSMGFG
jgi:hypothetical protein